MEKLLEVIRTNFLLVNEEAGVETLLASPGDSVSPHQAQGPPGLPSVPGLCSPVPPPKACHA